MKENNMQIQNTKEYYVITNDLLCYIELVRKLRYMCIWSCK